MSLDSLAESIVDSVVLRIRARRRYTLTALGAEALKKQAKNRRELSKVYTAKLRAASRKGTALKRVEYNDF